MGIKKGFYTRLTRELKKAGCFTAFDTSGAALMEGIRAGADLVKINKSEFEEVFGHGLSRPAILKVFSEYSPRGLQTLIVTNGRHSTLAVSRSGSWTAKPVQLKRVVSPVGAGDSFMACFINGFMKGAAFETNLKLATACAASDCLTLGAGYICRGEAETFAESVKIKKL